MTIADADLPRVVAALRAPNSPLTTWGVLQPPTQPASTGSGATTYVKGVIENMLTTVVQSVEGTEGLTTPGTISIT